MTTTNKAATKKELIAIINKSNESGKTRGAIEGYLQFEYDMSVNESKDLVQEVLGKASGGEADWSDTVAFIRKNYGKMDKKDLINNMCEIKGAKYSSMNHAYNYIKFAIEYAKQEVEASK